MGYKKVNLPKYWIPENVGDSVEGKIVGRGSAETAFGDMEYITLFVEGDERINVGLKSCLRLYSALLIDEAIIKIVYNGERVNAKTKHKFKSYDLYIYEE